MTDREPESARGGLPRAVVRSAVPIGPPGIGEWPDSRAEPLYWVARGTFQAAGTEPLELLVAAERHYELYLNDRFAGRARNFANGDEYLYCRRWTGFAAGLLRPGANVLEVVVRTDPWRNKNHRCFRPMLLAELRDQVSGLELLASGSSWEVSVVEDWHSMIGVGGNGTIHFDRVAIPPTSRSVLSGFAERTRWDRAMLLDSPLPPLYLWSDTPASTVTHRPTVVASGACGFVDRAYLLGAPHPSGTGRQGVRWTAQIELPEERELLLAAPATGSYRLELDGETVFERNDLPDRHQMQLPNYLIPAGSCALAPGRHALALSLRGSPRGHATVPVGLGGLSGLDAAVTWMAQGSAPPGLVESRPVALAERTGAKVWLRQRQESRVEADAQAIRVFARGVAASAVLDFGTPLNATVSLRIHSSSAGRLCLAYGFALSSGAVDCDKMAMHAADVLEVDPGESRYVAFDRRAFRYIDLVFEGFAGDVEVVDLVAEEPVFFPTERFALETPDSRLDAVCRAALRTTVLCADELYVDNPEREHAQWADPILAISSAGHYVAGREAATKTRKVLFEILATQQPDGQWAGYAPGKWFPRLPLQCHMSLVAVACHRSFMHTGDTELAARALDAVLRAVEHWERHRDRSGLLADLHTVFVDWGSHIYSYGRGCSGPTGALTTMNCYYAGVLERFAELARHLGRRTTEADLQALAAGVRSAIRHRLFDPAAGLFRDGVGLPEAEREHSQTANCLAVWAGAAPQGAEADLLRRAFDPPPGVDVIPANSLFFAMLGAEILFGAGCGELALRITRDRYGAMVDAGPGTLWETWYPHASLCQGTGAGLVYALSRYLVGLYPAEPGYRRIGLDPHPCGIRRVDARLSTPSGAIAVGWMAEPGALRVELRLPRALRDAPVLAPPTVDGMPLDLDVGELGG